MLPFYLNIYPFHATLAQSKSYFVHMPFSLEEVQSSSSLTQFFPKAKDREKQRGGVLRRGVKGREEDKGRNERGGNKGEGIKELR